MTDELKEAIQASAFCISVIKNHMIAEEDNAIWSVGTSSKPRITEKGLRLLAEAATERDTLKASLCTAIGVVENISDRNIKLEKQLEVAVKAITHHGCSNYTELQKTLSEIERIGRGE